MEVLSGFFEGREKRFQLSCFEPGVFADMVWICVD